MKKFLARTLAMVLVIMTVLALMSPALADSVSQKSDADGDCKKTFYVKTSTTNKELSMVMTHGDIAATSNGQVVSEVFNKYDSYEITIWYWNKNDKKWVKEQNYDIYAKKSATIKLKKYNTYYKITVDSYGIGTLVKSYVKNNVIKYSERLNEMGKSSDPYTYIWTSKPSWKVVDKWLGCTFYTKNPVK